MEVHLDIESSVAAEDKTVKLPEHFFVNFGAIRRPRKVDADVKLDLSIRPIGDQPLQRQESLLAW